MARRDWIASQHIELSGSPCVRFDRLRSLRDHTTSNPLGGPTERTPQQKRIGLLCCGGRRISYGVGTRSKALAATRRYSTTKQDTGRCSYERADDRAVGPFLHI